jgi:S1-C subfamily serine protease
MYIPREDGKSVIDGGKEMSHLRLPWLVAGLALVAIAWPARENRAADDLVDLVKRVGPAVVRVSTDTTFGSGSVADERGWILTNFHVIHGARTAIVSFQSGEQYHVRGFLWSIRGAIWRCSRSMTCGDACR